MDIVSKELAIFWRKFGRMLETGVPLFQSLNVLARETGSTELQEAIGKLTAAIKAGNTMSEGLAQSESLFPLSVRTIVKAGEVSGRLDKVAFQIADGIDDGSLLASGASPAPEASPREAAGGKPPVPESDVSVIQQVEHILCAAWKARASDIHMESTRGDLRVRFRVDGVLRDMPAVPARNAAAFVSRLKLMAGMNVVEKRLPQDGRSHMTIEGQDVDLRVSCTPCLDGENLVLRILVLPAQLPKLEAHGFTPPQIAMLRSWLARPSGLILIAGPTGSGKTTTIYSAIQEMNRPEIKIVMAEDPIELRLPGISQLQVRPALGLTFASALRAFMRQDPDVIVATEIRDRETAHILVQAALTGHLVISTLHTNDSVAAVQRLMDIGMDPFLVNSALIGVICQRLVRCVCRKCREEYQPESWVRDSVTIPAGAPLVHGKGCDACSQTGYHGRQAVHECLEMNDTLRKAVKEEADAEQLKALAVRSGMVTLRDDGIAKALNGVTTLEEVLRTCG